MLQNIPMLRLPWNLQESGCFETDLVHHSGPSASGEYVCTLQMIYVLPGWSERWAVLGCSYLVMEDAFRGIMHRLPFPMVEIHPDNGSEFLNHHMSSAGLKCAMPMHQECTRSDHPNCTGLVHQK
jgi:hypothetical protein